MFGFLLEKALEWCAAHALELISVGTECHKDSQKAKEEQRKQREEQQKQIAATQKLQEEAARKQKFLEYKIMKMCQNTILLDTCVWENADNYADFFATLKNICKKNKRKITILAQVYREIKKHFNSDDENDKYRARIAKRMIEQYQNENIVAIEDDAFDDHHAEADVYADPAIRRFASKHISNNTGFTVITEDTELRISLKNIVSQKGNSSNMKIYSVSELIS